MGLADTLVGTRRLHDVVFAYRMEMAKIPHKEVEALHEDIGDIDFSPDQPRLM